MIQSLFPAMLLVQLFDPMIIINQFNFDFLSYDISLQYDMLDRNKYNKKANRMFLLPVNAVID